MRPDRSASPCVVGPSRRAVLRSGGVAAGGLIVLTNTVTIAQSLGAPGTVVLSLASVTAALWLSGIGWAVQQERAARDGVLAAAAH